MSERASELKSFRRQAAAAAVLILFSAAAVCGAGDWRWIVGEYRIDGDRMIDDFFVGQFFFQIFSQARGTYKLWRVGVKH